MNNYLLLTSDFSKHEGYLLTRAAGYTHITKAPLNAVFTSFCVNAKVLLYICII